jgi:type IV secretory pathway TrbD component
MSAAAVSTGGAAQCGCWCRKAARTALQQTLAAAAAVARTTGLQGAAASSLSPFTEARLPAWQSTALHLLQQLQLLLALLTTAIGTSTTAAAAALPLPRRTWTAAGAGALCWRVTIPLVTLLVAAESGPVLQEGERARA